MRWRKPGKRYATFAMICRMKSSRKFCVTLAAVLSFFFPFFFPFFFFFSSFFKTFCFSCLFVPFLVSFFLFIVFLFEKIPCSAGHEARAGARCSGAPLCCPARPHQGTGRRTPGEGASNVATTQRNRMQENFKSKEEEEKARKVKDAREGTRLEARRVECCTVFSP